MTGKTSCAAFAVAILVGATAVEARERALDVYRPHRALTQSRVAPVGTEQTYITNSTILNVPIYDSFQPDAFGRDVLPGRFGRIGR